MSYQDTMNVILPSRDRQSPHITGHFGETRANGPHGGSDFNYEGGQTGVNVTHPAVHSPVAGTVTFVGGQYGTIKIRDAAGNGHEILHTDSQSVTVGQNIAAGDEIGTMGGRGPHGATQYAQHVHYQMKDSQGRPINPEVYWNERTPQAASHTSTDSPLRRDAMPIGELRQGSHGSAVRDMQRQLKELGYVDMQGKPIQIDGNFGPNTRHALELFQRGHGLAVDGIAGPETQNELRDAFVQRQISTDPKASLRMDDPNHGAYPMFQQSLSCIDRLNADRGIASSPRDSNIAGALTMEATAKGLTRIDHVVLNDDASRVFAVQGRLGGIQGLEQRWASVDTMTAIRTPLEQSSTQWAQGAEQAEKLQAQQQQVQARQHTEPSIGMVR